MAPEKFIAPFIDFVEINLPNFQEHVFFVHGNRDRYPIRERKNVIFSTHFHWKGTVYFNLNYLMHRAEKIILHGLWNMRVVQLLFYHPWLLRKCYWVMWGGDFYFPEKQSWYKKWVIKRIGF